MDPLAGDTGSIIGRIQSGDGELREQFITARLPFIKRAVAKITHVYFVEQEDEFEIALESFNDAIDRYRLDSSASFESFAYLVIRNRIYDWMRKQKLNHKTISLAEQDCEDGLTLEERLPDPHSEDVQDNLEFAEEMVDLELHLQEFGFKLTSLASHFPKHQDSRCLCIRVARQISSDPILYNQMVQSHHLPGKELATRCHLPIKTIEKNRASIIFLALLMKSSFETIQGYLSVFERGCPQ